MSLLSPDSERYHKAIEDLAHLVRTFGGKEVLLDLKLFFVDEYEELVKAARTEERTKQLARLLDANQGRRCGIRVAYDSMVVERSDSPEGN